jgi:hypothetical protein
MSNVEIDFDLIAGKNEVSKALSETSREVEKLSATIKRTSSNSDSFLTSLKSNYVAVGAAIYAVTSAAGSFFRAAAEAEENVSRLNIALKQTGIYSVGASQGIQSLSASLAKNSTYTDDAILSTSIMLQNLGQFTKEGLEKATIATVELASAMKMDLESAATFVGKAASGNTIALGKMGIEIKKGKNDAETFANTLSSLARFSGSAEAATKTLGGSVKSLSNSFSEIIESLGKSAFGDAFVREVNKIKNGLDQIRSDMDVASFSDVKLPKLIPALKQKRKIDLEITASKMPKEIQNIFSLDTRTIQLDFKTASANPFLDSINQIGEATTKTSKLLLDTETRRAEAAQKAKDEFLKAYEMASEQRSIDRTNEERWSKDREDGWKKFNDQIMEGEKKRVEFIKNMGELGATPLQGKAGAEKLLLAGSKAGLNALSAGLGDAAGPLIQGLMQGPEQTKAMVKEFAQAIPDLVSNLVESAPVFIEELANQAPKIIEKLAKKFTEPAFLEALAKSAIYAATAGAAAFMKDMISKIPDFFKNFGEGLIQVIKDAFNSATGGIADIGGGGGAVGTGVRVQKAILTGGLSEVFGFARGGQVSKVPNGFPNDSFPAMLQSSELVVDRSTAERLNAFLDGNMAPESSTTDSLLALILNKLSEPMNVATSANINGKAFADIILQLNRNNARLTA